MISTPTDPFNLAESLQAKSAPRLIGGDRAHFVRIADTLQRRRSEMTTRLAAARRMPADSGGVAVERDLEIRRLSTRLRLLDRFGVDLCLGRMTPAGGGDPLYVGRAGLRGPDGTQLLIDWRTPAAEPYFAATREHPRGIVSRRRYRWAEGRVTDYWDEVLTDEGIEDEASLDTQSAFIAGLGSHRTSKMRDVLATIQADQDVIIRTPSAGALVVDGGPGTGKTVVALHRAAHLLYAEPRLTHGGGGMLLVGPHAHYLAYVDDVLPSLGEDSVRLCTLDDLVPEGPDAAEETDPRVARIKGSLDPTAIIDTALAEYRKPPQLTVKLESPWADLWITPREWTELFDSADPGTPHNEARNEVWDEIVEFLIDQVDDSDAPQHVVRRWLRQENELTDLFLRAWPMLSPAAVVARLWDEPDFLLRCAPQLTGDEATALRRAEPRAWTVSDLPLLDAAHRRIGDPEAARREHRRHAAIASAQEQMAQVVDQLIENDDSEMQLMSILRGQDARNVLADVDAPAIPTPDELAGPFAHIVIDEAQELDDAQWRMILARCPSRSLTIVGDRAQARHGFTESWSARLQRVGIRDVRLAHLSLNYRTPAEVMTVAAPEIVAALPDANVPTSVRTSGLPVREELTTERDRILTDWLTAHPDGVACVIGDATFSSTPRVRSLTPAGAKGLEFDLVLLTRPEQFGDDITGAVDRYVAMTRTTSQLVILRARHPGHRTSCSG